MFCAIKIDSYASSSAIKDCVGFLIEKLYFKSIQYVLKRYATRVDYVYAVSRDFLNENTKFRVGSVSVSARNLSKSYLDLPKNINRPEKRHWHVPNTLWNCTTIYCVSKSKWKIFSRRTCFVDTKLLMSQQCFTV